MDRFLIKVPTCATSSKKRKRDDAVESSAHNPPKSKAEQMFLDLGQKKFGKNAACERCGMVYVNGHSEDEQRHTKFCKAVNSTFRLSSTKNYRMLVEHEDFSIAEHVGPRDKDDLLQRVISTVCNALGTPTEMVPSHSKVYIYLIRSNIVGFLNAEGLGRDRCALISRDDNITQIKITNAPVNSDVICMGEEGFVDDMVMGIRKIWVCDQFRLTGVARKLVDTARRYFVYTGVKKSDIAFSQPTMDGRSFAFSYIKKDKILAYG